MNRIKDDLGREFISKDDIQQLLLVSRSSLWRMASRNSWRTEKRGNRTYILADDFLGEFPQHLNDVFPVHSDSARTGRVAPDSENVETLETERNINVYSEKQIAEIFLEKVNALEKITVDHRQVLRGIQHLDKREALLSRRVKTLDKKITELRPKPEKLHIRILKGVVLGLVGGALIWGPLVIYGEILSQRTYSDNSLEGRIQQRRIQGIQDRLQKDQQRREMENTFGDLLVRNQEAGG